MIPFVLVGILAGFFGSAIMIWLFDSLTRENMPVNEALFLSGGVAVFIIFCLAVAVELAVRYV